MSKFFQLHATPERRAQLLAERVDHFTTFLLLAYAQAMFIRPMMRNVELIGRMGVGPRRAGFEQLRQTLYWNVVLEIMKLCSDRDRRTASVPSIMLEVRDPLVRKVLLKRYCRIRLPRIDGESYPAWRKQGSLERAESNARFKACYRRLRSNCTLLKNSREFRAFKKVRNEMLAHRQVVTKAGSIKPLDLGALRLKFGDERKVLELTRAIAEDLNSLVRGASFSWDSYLQSETRDVCGFWEIDSLDGPVSA